MSFDLADVVRGDDVRRASSIDKISDIARMFTLPKATRMLTPELIASASPAVAQMLRASVEGEVRRHAARQAAARSGAPSREAARSSAIARALNRPTLAELDIAGVGGRGEAVGALDAETAAELGARWSVSAETMRRLASDALGARLDVRAGRGGDEEMLAVTMRRTAPAPRLRRATGERLATSGGPSVELTISAAAGASPRWMIGAVASGAESYAPQALSLARHEDRVAAELRTMSGGAGVQLLDLESAARPVSVLSEPGDVVRLGFTPEVLARMVREERSRRSSLAAVTADAVARGEVSADERRAIAASVMGTRRVELFERIFGGVEPVATEDVSTVARALRELRDGERVPVRQIESTMREVLTRSGGRGADLAREIEARVPGLRVESRAPVGAAYRALGAAVDDFVVSARAARPATERAGYFESLVPSGFASGAASRGLARAFAPAATLAEGSVLERTSGRDIRRLPIEALRTSATAREVGTLRAGETYALRVGTDGTYEVVRPAALSPVLDRFARDVAGATSAGSRARFVSRSGEPGDLGGRLEVFSPTSASRRQSSLFTSQRALVEPPLSRRTPARFTARRTAASGDVDAAVATLRAGGEATLERIGEEVASRLADRGSALYFVEAPTGLTETEVREMFSMGSGDHAQRRGGRHDVVGMLDRVQNFVTRARSMSDRRSTFGRSAAELAALVRSTQSSPSASSSASSGLPPWASAEAQGAALRDLREMLKQVSSMPMQGVAATRERALVDPSAAQGAAGLGQPAPLFSAGARSELMPSNQVRAREQAQRTSDTGKPAASDLEAFAKAVYDLLKEKLRDQLFRERST